MAKSIIQSEKCCFVCETTLNLHEHHIFFGTSNRKNSEKYGLKVWLCYHHHNGSNEGVHFNKALDTRLKQYGQEIFNEKYPELSFREIFGKNYL